MQTVAQSWLVYRMTGSATLLGVVGFASQFPIFLLSPLGGAVSDSYPRRHSMIAIQTAAMLLAFPLAVLTLTNRIQVWHVIVLALLLGAVNAFDIPVRQAFFVEMVGRQDLMNALALNSSMVNGARIVGPAVAGLLVAAVGEGWCFLLNGISYIPVIAGLTMIKSGNRPPVEHHGSRIKAIVVGLHFVWRTRPIRALLLLIGLVSLMGMPYSVLMPIFANQILNGGPKSLGLLMGSSGIGALVAALILVGRRGMRGLSKWVMMACGGFGVSLVLFAFSRNLWLSVLLLLPVGFSMMLQLASTNTLIQAMAPDHFRGRVMSMYSMMFMGMSPIGALLAGVFAHSLGAPGAVAAGGAACIAAALVFRSHLPALTAEGRELIDAQMMVPAEPAEAETGEVTGQGSH